MKLRQAGPNPFAVGASVEILALGVRTRRPVLAGASYLSQHSYRLHFGLGRYARAPAVRVRLWIDRTVLYGPGQSRGRIATSIRRLRARPSGVWLLATG